MICDFSKISSCEAVVMYHEKKVREGKASLLFNGTFSDGDRADAIIKSLNEMAVLNLNVSKNRFFNCSINLPIFEDLPDEKFTELARDYLSEMGYADCPFLIYRHSDKGHHHIHVICTTVNFSGEKVKDFNDQYNSERISRQLEQRHGLYRVEKKGMDRKKLSEINSARYSLSKAICKCFQSVKKRNEMLGIIPYSLYFSIKEKAIDNNKLLDSLGEEKYEQLVGFLHENKLFDYLNKEKLISVLSTISYTSREEYERLCREKGIYIRQVFNKGRASYVYGLSDCNFYIKDTKLPGRYVFLSIDASKGRVFGFSQQKKYVQTMASVCLKESRNMDEYRQRLQGKNIKLILHENSSGVYGISYQPTSVENPFVIKSSALQGLSYESICREFSQGKRIPSGENTLDTAQQEKTAQRVRSAIPTLRGKGKRKQEEEDYPPRKRKKRKGRNL